MTVQIADYQEVANWQTSGASKSTSANITWQDGDLIVFAGAVEGPDVITVPTATGLTFSSAVVNSAASTCGTRIATALASGSGSQLVTSTTTAGALWGYGVWVLRGHNGTGVTAEQHTTTHTVSLAATAGSLVLWVVGDFSAAAVQAESPTADVDREQSTSANYTAYAEELNNVPGTQSYGLSAGGTTGVLSIAAIEIRAVAASGRTPFNPIPFMGR